MDGDFSSCRMRIMLQISIYLIVMAIAANAKITGTFKCTPPRHTAIICSTTKLPAVTEGSFGCVPNSYVPNGEACALTCNDGFYAAYSDQAVCEAGTITQGGVWSYGSFECRAITCSTTKLPTVSEGSLDCKPHSYVPKGDACALTCNDGFYAAYSDQTVCEAGAIYQGGVWSNGSFVCHVITCSTTNLPTVTEGSFNCTHNSNVSKGTVCALTCNSELYPAYSRLAVCVAGISNQGGVWSNGRFMCHHPECNDWNEWNGSEYKLTSTVQTWETSRQFCESENSHLVFIENKEENEFVYRIVRHCNRNQMTWIGLNDRNTEGTWEWIDGTVSTYRNWGEGEPNGGDTEDCMGMDVGNGDWYDFTCGSVLSAVCERNDPLT